ncbi:MAG: FtsH protease activity modulator HflK [Alphaproteobacteria bacterium]
MSSEDDNGENPWDVKNEPQKKPAKDSEPKQTRGNDSNQGQLDFGKIIGDFQRRFKEARNGGGNGGRGGSSPSGNQSGFIAILGTLLIAVWFGSGFYNVGQDEISVVLRFGKMEGTYLPGWHYRLPAPIEREIIKKTVVNQIDSSTTHEGDSERSLILTGDENMVLTDYTIMWKIKDITQYIFVVRNPDETIRAAAESALREIMGQTTALKALTGERLLISNQVQELLQKILDSYNTGVQITSFQLQKVSPPAQVLEAFNDMQASKVDADRLSNEAQSYTNDILPKARGQAESILRGAEAYAAEIVAKAEGEAARFNQVQIANRKNQRVTRIRMHRETMDELMKRGVVTIVDKDLAKSLQNYNQLNPAALLKKKEIA